MLDLHGCKRVRMQSHPFHYTVILWSQATSQPNTRWAGHRPPCKLLFSPSCLWFAHMCSITCCHPFPPFRASAVTQGGSQQIRCAGSPASDTNQVTSGDNQLLLLTIPSLYLTFLNSGRYCSQWRELAWIYITSLHKIRALDLLTRFSLLHYIVYKCHPGKGEMWHSVLVIY